MKLGKSEHHPRSHVALDVFRSLTKPLAMQAQSFFHLHFARSQLPEQRRNPLQVRRELRLHLRHRALHLLIAHRLDRWRNPLRHPGREHFDAARHLRRLRVQYVFQPAMQFVQTVMAGRFKLRRIFPDARRRSFDFFQRSARIRNLLFERRSNFRQRLARFCRRLRHGLDQIGKSLAHFCARQLCCTSCDLCGQLLDEPLQAAIERGLQQFVPLRLREIHFRLQTLAPGAKLAFSRAAPCSFELLRRCLRRARRFRCLRAAAATCAIRLMVSCATRLLRRRASSSSARTRHQFPGAPEILFNFGLEPFQKFALPSCQMFVELFARFALRLLEFFSPTSGKNPRSQPTPFLVPPLSALCWICSCARAAAVSTAFTACRSSSARSSRRNGLSAAGVNSGPESVSASEPWKDESLISAMSFPM